jgi:hypothetical protein
MFFDDAGYVHTTTNEATMKLEVGKIYLDRCGDRWEIVHHRPGDHWPFTGRTVKDALAFTFDEDGCSGRGPQGEFDLISEVPEVVTIKLYRHRETGQIVPTGCKTDMNNEAFEYIKTIEVEL